MDTTKVQNQILLTHHFFGHIDKRHILSHGIAVLVGRPVLRWLSRHTRTVLHKRVVDVNINRCTIALRLPVARHRDSAPLTHIIVLTIEINGPFLRISTPTELPLSVETHNLLALLLLRRKLQRRVIWQFVDTQYSGVLPIVYSLCLYNQHQGVYSNHSSHIPII